MKRFTSRLIAVVAFFLVVACQRDPGRDVQPMADPLRTGSASPTPPEDQLSQAQDDEDRRSEGQPVEA